MLIEQILHIKEKRGDDRIIEISVWKIPQDKDRQHGYKYRLHYGYLDGVCIIRYDNERKKGDHRHVGASEQPYIFTTLQKLMHDFKNDVEQHDRNEGK